MWQGGTFLLYEVNSVNLDCDKKFQNVKDSAFVLRQLNDEICLAHGLSVIENPKDHALPFGETAAIRHGESFKEKLRQTIDRLLPDCTSFEDFLARMRSEGYEVKQGKHLAFRAPDQSRFTRSFRLGDSYTKEALQERIESQHGRFEHSAPTKKLVQRKGKKVNLLIDIQAKLNAGKGDGYAHWAKLFNLKEAAKTLNFLIDNDLTDYDALVERVEQIQRDFEITSLRIKQLEGRMAEIATLKKHIINYSKTRSVYAAYKKSRHKKEFRAEHADELEKHEAAKKAFDAFSGKSLPKVAELSEQYAALLAEKQEAYAAYTALRQDMISYRTAQQNVDKILGIVEPPQPEKQQTQDR